MYYALTFSQIIVSVFPNDINIEKICLDIVKGKESIWKLIEWLPLYCKENGWKLFAIFDQHDESEHRLCTKYHKAVEKCIPCCWFHQEALCVISETAFYDYELEVLKYEFPQFHIQTGFNDFEFDIWQQYNNFFIGEDITEVKYWTGLIPNELKLLLDYRKNDPNANLQDVLKKYCNVRGKMFFFKQVKFMREYIIDLQQAELAKKSVVYMELQLPMDQFSQQQLLNSQLMYIDEKDLCIRAVSPLAHKCLLEFWRDLDDDLDGMTSIVFSHYLPNSAKEYVAKNYIKRKMKKFRSLDLILSRYDAELPPAQWKKSRVSVNNLQIVEFLGYTFPPRFSSSSVDWKQPAIFFPIFHNYPDIDFAIWDPKQKLLWAFQITFGDPTNHSCDFFEMKNRQVHSDAWKQKCIDGGGNCKEVRYVWISRYSNLGDKPHKQYIAKMDGILKFFSFPLLQQ
jgi:hypothetical protein